MNKRTKTGLILGLAALVLIVGLVLLLIFLPEGGNGGDTSYVPKEYNSVEATVDESNVRTVQVPVDEKGEVKENLSGELIDLQPSYLKTVKIESESGIYEFDVSTDSQGATTYVLKGFEGFGLNNTNASLIGSAISNIEMAALIDATGETKSDYGFDNPRSKVTATFTDGSVSEVFIGDDAPGGTHTYIMMGGCPSVFSVLSTEVAPLLLDLNDMFDLNIRNDYSTVSDEDFTYITLGGTHLSEEVTIAHSDGSLQANYIMTSHGNAPVNAVAGSNVMGSIKSLAAKEIAFANPDANALATMGLDNPYATVKAEYVFTSSDTGKSDSLYVSMICSAPDSEGNVYLMNEGEKLVYLFSKDSLAWATVTESDLRSEYVHAPAYSAVDTLTVSDGKESYTFDVSTKSVEVTDAETGEATTQSVTVVKFGDKEIDEAYYRILFDDMALITCKGDATAADKNSEIFSVTYGYLTDRADDTVKYYSTSSQKVVPEVNGNVNCYIYKSDIDGIMANAKALSEGKEIKSILG